MTSDTPAPGKDGRLLRIAFKPLASPYNPFTRLFADSIINAREGAVASHFSWTLKDMRQTDILVLHWPNEFFRAMNFKGRIEALVKLTMLKTFRRLMGGRVVWLAHNIEPHESGASMQGVTDSFLSTLSGIIFLSAATEHETRKRYPRLAGTPSLLIRHGRYPVAAPPPPLPSAQDKSGVVRLLYFGALRGYKGVDDLIRIMHDLPDPNLRLLIAGRTPRDFDASPLLALAQGDPRIAFKISAQAIPDKAVDDMIHASDALILPYSKLGNSGVAILALSHHRPILAPNLGSMPELRQDVGGDWVHLFDGPINSAHLSNLGKHFRQRRMSGAPDLRQHEWDRIGSQVREFISGL